MLFVPCFLFPCLVYASKQGNKELMITTGNIYIVQLSKKLIVYLISVVSLVDTHEKLNRLSVLIINI